MMARSTLRPIRPKPLIATLTVIFFSFMARAAKGRADDTRAEGFRAALLKRDAARP
jgi:hypothetical protein